MTDRAYSTRLQKGGALLHDMRQLLLVWDGQPDCAARVVQENRLASPSRSRLQDVIRRTFMPRFVRSQPPNLWRAVAILEKNGWTQQLLLPIHYYATASAEPLLWDFASEVLAARYARGQADVSPAEVIRFIEQTPASRFQRGRWSEEVKLRVARGVLAALRDLGVLSGATKKRLSPLYLPAPSFAFIAMIRYQLGVKGRNVLSDHCWQLFYLDETGVERFFMEAHQQALLQYHAAGSVIRIDFPAATLEEYAHVLSQ